MNTFIYDTIIPNFLDFSLVLLIPVCRIKIKSGAHEIILTLYIFLCQLSNKNFSM